MEKWSPRIMLAKFSGLKMCFRKARTRWSYPFSTTIFGFCNHYYFCDFSKFPQIRIFEMSRDSFEHSIPLYLAARSIEHFVFSNLQLDLSHPGHQNTIVPFFYDLYLILKKQLMRSKCWFSSIFSEIERSANELQKRAFRLVFPTDGATSMLFIGVPTAGRHHTLKQKNVRSSYFHHFESSQWESMAI